MRLGGIILALGMAAHCQGGDFWTQLENPGSRTSNAKSEPTFKLSLNIENFTGNFTLTDGITDYPVSATGIVEMPQEFQMGEPFFTAIKTQPMDSKCEIDVPQGTMIGNRELIIRCGYIISGKVFGNNPAGLIISNGAENLNVTANGDFTFTRIIAPGSTYSVNVVSQPTSGIPCRISSASGTASAMVNNVSISCFSPVNLDFLNVLYTIGNPSLQTASGSNGFYSRINTTAAGTGYFIYLNWLNPTLIRYYFRGSANFTCRVIIGDDTTSENNWGSLRVRTNAGMIWPDGAAIGTAYTLNVWHKMEYRNINWVTKTAEIYLNDVYKGSAAFTNTSAASFRKMYILNDAAGSCDIDEVFIE